MFELKQRIFSYIEEREAEVLQSFFKRFGQHKRIRVLGPHVPEKRVPIVSFVIEQDGPNGMRILNSTFVISLLSDLFGIQGRAGCSCAGPYGHYLLGIGAKTSELYEHLLTEYDEDEGLAKIQGVKPGWARINLHYTMTD